MFALLHVLKQIFEMCEKFTFICTSKCIRFFFCPMVLLLVIIQCISTNKTRRGTQITIKFLCVWSHWKEKLVLSNSYQDFSDFILPKFWPNNGFWWLFKESHQSLLVCVLSVWGTTIFWQKVTFKKSHELRQWD